MDYDGGPMEPGSDTDTDRDLRAIIDTIPTTAWTARPDGSCDFLNRRWLEYAGMTAEQALGWGWVATIHPADRERVLEYWKSCLASGGAAETEARMRRYDGDYRWFLIRASPLRDAAGNITRWFGTSIDIERRKLAEQTLESNERNLNLILNTIPTTIHVLAADSTVLYVNQAVLDYTGLTMDEVRRHDYRARTFHPEDLARVREARLAGLSGTTSFEFEQRVRARDGSYRWFLTRFSPLLDTQGRVDRWYVAAFDIEERKRMEHALEEARAELAHVSRVMTLGALTASIAHEVNQPLTGIVTNASTGLSMLAADPPNIEGARTTTQRTLRDANRAAAVIQRLRTLFTHKQPEYGAVDVNDAAREVLALSMSELRRVQVNLRTELAEDLPPVNGDRVQLQQVLINLILNAADAMKEIEDRPRDLLVCTVRVDDGIVVSVRDSGVGIQPQDLDRVFDAFYTTKPQGMGVGLSISRSIIQGHRGRLWASANDGPGATVSFCIPPLPVD